MAAKKILHRNAEILEFKGTVKFEHGFPVLLLEQDELDELLERIKAKAEKEKDERRKKSRTLIVETLAPLNGFHRNQRIRIENEDFKRLCDYATVYFLDGDLPKNFEPILKTNISAHSVRHIFYQLYEKVNESGLIQIEREAAVNFMKKVFYKMFRDTEASTLFKKFSEKAPKGFPD